MDKGWGWMVLIGCFFNHALCDGLMQSFGVFLVTWHEQFPGSVTQLTWIISLIVGVAHVIGPIGSALCKTFSIRQVAMVGAILTSLSLIAASLATSLLHLYLSVTLTGIGLGLTMQPCIVIITYYFNKKLARANGIAFAGVAVGIFALPPLFQLSIDIYGWQGALLIAAGLIGNIGVCAALYRPTTLEIESRTGIQTDISKNVHDRSNTCRNVASKFVDSFDFNLCRNFHFCCILAANFLTGTAYVIVFYYLVPRAVDAGIPELHSAFLVSVVGISSFISRITHGFIIDYQILTATVLTALAYFVCALSSALNPLTDNFSSLVTLSVLVGLSSGVFVSTVSIITKKCVGAQHVSGGVGLILLMTGGGDMLGSYLTGVLVDATGSYDIPFYLAGACFLLCSLLIFAHPLIQWHRHHDNSGNGPKKDLHLAKEQMENTSC